MASITRRGFLGSSAALAASIALPSCASPRRQPRPLTDKLRIGLIGVGGRGGSNLRGILDTGEDIVAICDIDERILSRVSERLPSAEAFVDFRELLARPDLDAAVISTPDHTHAPAAAMALRNGLDVYCEKPLTHSVYETRVLTELAQSNGAVTQMGTQIHANDNYRRVVEIVQAGVLGRVREVHVFCDKAWGGARVPTESMDVPAHIHWDLWLGPAPERPYHEAYLPADWRRFWAFGGGTLSDMACHFVDLPFWALGLTSPVSIEATGPSAQPETTPIGMAVRWEFPACQAHDATTLTWSDGDQRPPALAEHGLEKWRSGVLFVGEEGWLVSNYDLYEIGPQSDFVNFTPPIESIPNSDGHYRDWTTACKTRGETTCHFGYSGPLTETVLLGNVAFRSGQRIDWDSPQLLITNSAEAQDLLRRNYRAGWAL